MRGEMVVYLYGTTFREKVEIIIVGHSNMNVVKCIRISGSAWFLEI